MKKFTMPALPSVGLTDKDSMLLVSLLIAFAFYTQDVQALEVECEIPLSVVCEVSDPKGFMSVRVNVDFGDLGEIDVATYTFPVCRTNATVSWDQIVPNFQIFTTGCESGPVKGFTFENETIPTFRVKRFLNNVAKPPSHEINDTSDLYVQAKKFTIGVSQILSNGSGVSAVKFCDNTKVEDDITECAIGEIAWECPDGATGPSEDCKADVHGGFDD